MNQSNREIDPAKISRSDNPRINADPPAASGRPLEGQVETNETLPPSRELNWGEDETDPLHRAAYQFGWQSYLQYGRLPATESFDVLEPKLRRDWEQGQQARTDGHTWDAAKAIVQDAWNKVHDAMAAG